MRMKNRILAFLLATIMLFSSALPVSAQEIEPVQEIFSITEEAEAPAEESEEIPLPEQEDSPSYEAEVSLGQSNSESEAPAESRAFFLDCTPEQAAKLIAFYEFVSGQIQKQSGFRLFAASGDSGTVTWNWGEAVGIEVPSGDPNNPYHIGNIPKIKLSTAKQPLGRPFCVEFGNDPGGSYTASEGSDRQVLKLLVAHQKGKASAVGVQLALWDLENGLPLRSHPEAAAALSAAASVSTTGYTYLVWDSGSGQPFVTLDKESSSSQPDPDLDPGDDDDEDDDKNPNTRTEVTTDTSTRTELRSSTGYEYGDGIGQITIVKRDQDGKSLDGAIFKVEVVFANGQRGGDSAFEVHNGSRLFTYTHPANDHQPARVTVTEVRAPDGYIADPTPKTAVIHPTYTRITKVLTHTITITITTTTTSVIDIDSGEVLSESSASADSETELSPPTVQEYADFVEGDRETALTFVNTVQVAELVIFKYTPGKVRPWLEQNLR